MSISFPRFTVLTGNYGSGKTELALNLAIGFAAAGKQEQREKKEHTQHFAETGISDHTFSPLT